MFLAQLILGIAWFVGGQSAENFEQGVEAYRRGSYGEATALWRSCLEDDLSAEDRARVAYNLGNAAWRDRQTLEAVGWYTVALEGDPRNPDIWHNLEYVRAEAELEPADRGDLRSTWNRVLASLTPGESRLLLLGSLGALLLVLLGEALYGGKFWRTLAACFLGLTLLLGVPWVGHLVRGDGDPVLVVRSSAVALRSEPRRELEPIAQLDPGSEVSRIDALPGWVRVETGKGLRGWLQEEAIFSLRP